MNLRDKPLRGRPSRGHQCRVPADYHWQVLRLLVDALKTLVPPELATGLEGSIRSRDPNRYYALGESFGLPSIAKALDSFELSGFDPATQYLLVSVMRKHPKMETVSKTDRRSRCIEAVKSLDAELLTESPYWTHDEVFRYMKADLQLILGPVPTVEVIADSARHGPGSSTTLGFNDRSKYFKYQDWPYPVCPRAETMLTSVIKLDQRWVGVLEDSYRRRYGIPPWRILNQDSFWKNVVHAEHCWNRVTTVPKDGTKDRPIAIEPAGNIFLQLGVEGVIRARLRAHGLNLDTQERNRELCLKFSRENSGYTIDLSNASDTISRKFCETMLPAGWFELLDSIRSPYGEFPDRTYWRYAKMSSMGNATTFVLESLLFWSLQRAVSRVYGHRSDRNVAFGDDLLGEGYLGKHMFIYLPLCGFAVNRNKSFLEGPVRESCGVDSYKGRDIRPVFLKTVPVTDRDLLSDRNRLNRWFAIHHGTRLPESLDNFFMKYLNLWEPGPESDTEFDTYWHVDCFPFVEFRSYAESATERSVKEFGFRKLMHDLRGASEGGRFLISKERVGKVRLVVRSPQVGGYSSGGVQYNHPKQPFC